MSIELFDTLKEQQGEVDLELIIDDLAKLTPEESMRAIYDLLQDVPARIALNRRKLGMLWKNPRTDYYITRDGDIITKEEREKYLRDSIVFYDCSYSEWHNMNMSGKELIEFYREESKNGTASMGFGIGRRLYD